MKIPSAVINGRISPHSYKNYMRLRFFFGYVFSQVTLFCMQSEGDAARIKDIGAAPDRVIVTGNLKFDQKIPTATASPVTLPPASKVITAGSTHRGEEAVLVEVFRRLREKFPDLVLILAPRHPERFDEVEGIVNRAGFDCQRRTRIKNPIRDVLLLDTIGELRSFYGICDIAFVGGSLVKVGGHNLLEPAAMKKPVVFSRYMFNFKEISEGQGRAVCSIRQPAFEPGNGKGHREEGVQGDRGELRVGQEDDRSSQCVYQRCSVKEISRM
jgi:3-deoxy-D-manno-octulosonic-acid transferase